MFNDYPKQVSHQAWDIALMLHIANITVFFHCLFYHFYCCLYTVVSIFPSPLSPTPPIPPPALLPSPLWLCPWVLYTCSLTTLSLLSPVISLPPPLSVCSLFQCLWLYFAPYPFRSSLYLAEFYRLPFWNKICISFFTMQGYTRSYIEFFTGNCPLHLI